jgi:molybdopterin synthase catalytic subunit
MLIPITFDLSNNITPRTSQDIEKAHDQISEKKEVMAVEAVHEPGHTRSSGRQFFNCMSTSHPFIATTFTG